jgi:hypothetical protein
MQMAGAMAICLRRRIQNATAGTDEKFIIHGEPIVSLRM